DLLRIGRAHELDGEAQHVRAVAVKEYEEVRAVLLGFPHLLKRDGHWLARGLDPKCAFGALDLLRRVVTAVGVAVGVGEHGALAEEALEGLLRRYGADVVEDLVPEP